MKERKRKKKSVGGGNAQADKKECDTCAFRQIETREEEPESSNTTQTFVVHGTQQTIRPQHIQSGIPQEVGVRPQSIFRFHLSRSPVQSDVCGKYNCTEVWHDKSL